MFFYISKILSGILFIYPLFIFFSLFAAWRMRPGTVRRLYFIFWLFVYLCSTHFFASILMQSLEKRYPLLEMATVPQADAIVLLGGMVHPLVQTQPDRPEFLGSVDRILLAEDLLHAGKAPLLVISGGNGLLMQAGPREADLLSNWLQRRGIKASQLLIEPISRNTAENAYEVHKLAAGRGWKRVLLVTSAFHMPRAMACFERMHAVEIESEHRVSHWEIVAVPVDYYAAPGFKGPESILPTPAAMFQTTLALKEYAGFVGYWMVGYI